MWICDWVEQHKTKQNENWNPNTLLMPPRKSGLLYLTVFLQKEKYLKMVSWIIDEGIKDWHKWVYLSTNSKLWRAETLQSVTELHSNSAAVSCSTARPSLLMARSSDSFCPENRTRRLLLVSPGRSGGLIPPVQSKTQAEPQSSSPLPPPPPHWCCSLKPYWLLPA